MDVVLMIMACVFTLAGYVLFGAAVVLAIRDEKKFAAECDVPICRHWYDFKEYIGEHILPILLAAVSESLAVLSLAAGYLISL